MKCPTLQIMVIVPYAEKKGELYNGMCVYVRVSSYFSFRSVVCHTQCTFIRKHLMVLVVVVVF